MKKTETKHGGLVALVICGVITVVLIVGCVFFPKEFFGLFTK